MKRRNANCELQTCFEGQVENDEKNILTVFLDIKKKKKKTLHKDIKMIFWLSFFALSVLSRLCSFKLCLHLTKHSGLVTVDFTSYGTVFKIGGSTAQEYFQKELIRCSKRYILWYWHLMILMYYDFDVLWSYHDILWSWCVKSFTSQTLRGNTSFCRR